ncbi:TrmH family RNA methyltransferase [Caulifigura coniformis]|uniref:TrmH family RNA methyltransferase n=1 Tax=Caulifigura coniformis TaxID=2527983 RepID=UPI0011A1BEC8|nr:RNA methyltransferase [Caulifigura coniformis]
MPTISFAENLSGCYGYAKQPADFRRIVNISSVRKPDAANAMARQSNRHQLPSQGSAEHFALWDYYHEYVTPERRARLAEVLRKRTRRIAVVLEDVRQSHNVSAVLRSCDAFGLQDVHVLEPTESFDPSTKVALGSQQWLTIRRATGADAIGRGIETLKNQGYRIVATVPPGSGAVPFEEINLDGPVAVVFGNEKYGITSEMAAAADQLTTIPMHGFVESLNISVAAALLIQSLSSRIRATRNDWELSSAEYEDLLFEWTRKSIPAVEFIEQRWLAERRAVAGPSHSRQPAAVE